jgi:hypothetical protein
MPQRQGNPQLGFEICPHTCGCIITQAAANRSRRKPQWMKWAPLALKDGRHLLNHIKTGEVHPNCSPTCAGFDRPGRDMTHEEWTAWAPLLGHYSPFIPHIPSRYRSLIPAAPLEEAYMGDLPSHPLPTAVPSLQQGLASISIHSNPAGPSTRSTSVGPSTLTTTQSRLGPRPRFIFVETPRLTGMEMTLESARGLLVYGRYLLQKSHPDIIKAALRTAPSGMAFLEDPGEDDQYPDVDSYIIHDMASIPFFFSFESFY